MFLLLFAFKLLFESVQLSQIVEYSHLNQPQSSAVSTDATATRFCYRFVSFFYGSRRTDEAPVEVVETQICDICTNNVGNTDFLRCCSNGHDIHRECFQHMVTSENEFLHNCPFCREPLILTPAAFHDKIMTHDSRNMAQWNAILGHFKLFKHFDPLLLRGQDWDQVYHHILVNSDAAHLKLFLDLKLVNVNQILFGETCAVSLLMRQISFNQGNDQKVAEFREKLQVLLDYPNFCLDIFFYVGGIKFHIVQEAIIYNCFDIFLAILEACSDEILSSVFRLICAQDNSDEKFFQYMLTLGTFDIFSLNKAGLSALHLAVISGNDSYAMALLESAQISLKDLAIKHTNQTFKLLTFVLENALFDTFLCILEASPDLDLEFVFRFLCRKKGINEIFFNYFLTCQQFDIFAIDSYSKLSALHYAVKLGNNSYALALLDSLLLTPAHLHIEDKESGNLLKLAKLYSSADVINKLNTLMN